LFQSPGDGFEFPLPCFEVKEFVRKNGKRKGDKWRLFEHLPSSKVYKSLSTAVAAGFPSPDIPDVD